MANANITVANKSATRLLVCDFRAKDNGIPYDTTWLEPGATGSLKTGDFTSLSIGCQVQEGGRWIGGDPADPPYASPGQTVTFAVTKVVS